jgi:hypothetical protein
MADSVNGYVMELKVYVGKEGNKAETNLGMKVASELTNSLPSGDHIYFDNFFTSIPLVLHLLHNDKYCCGTFRQNRKGIQQDMKNLKQGMIIVKIICNYL